MQDQVVKMSNEAIRSKIRRMVKSQHKKLKQAYPELEVRIRKGERSLSVVLSPKNTVAFFAEREPNSGTFRWISSGAGVPVGHTPLDVVPNLQKVLSHESSNSVQE